MGTVRLRTAPNWQLLVTWVRQIGQHEAHFLVCCPQPFSVVYSGLQLAARVLRHVQLALLLSIRGHEEELPPGRALHGGSQLQGLGPQPWSQVSGFQRQIHLSGTAYWRARVRDHRNFSQEIV